MWGPSLHSGGFFIRLLIFNFKLKYFRLFSLLALVVLILFNLANPIIFASSSVRLVVKTGSGVDFDQNISVPNGCSVSTDTGNVSLSTPSVACAIASSGLGYSFKNYLPELFLTSLNGKSGNWEYYVNGNYASGSMDNYTLGNSDTVVLTLNGASASLPQPVVSAPTPINPSPTPAAPAPAPAPKQIDHQGPECSGGETIWVIHYTDGSYDVTQHMGKIAGQCGNPSPAPAAPSNPPASSQPAPSPTTTVPAPVVASPTPNKPAVPSQPVANPTPSQQPAPAERTPNQTTPTPASNQGGPVSNPVSVVTSSQTGSVPSAQTTPQIVANQPSNVPANQTQTNNVSTSNTQPRLDRDQPSGGPEVVLASLPADSSQPEVVISSAEKLPNTGPDSLIWVMVALLMGAGVFARIFSSKIIAKNAIYTKQVKKWHYY